jgi:hypothetical protein
VESTNTPSKSKSTPRQGIRTMIQQYQGGTSGCDFRSMAPEISVERIQTRRSEEWPAVTPAELRLLLLSKQTAQSIHDVGRVLRRTSKLAA